MPVTLTDDQTRAKQLFRTGRNFFLSGDAGTGKSTLLRNYIDECHEERKQVLIMASTGIAAVNIGGTTAHRALRLPTRVIIPEDITEAKKAPKLLKHTDVLILDEVSMCRSDVFSLIGRKIELADKWRRKHGKPPIQLILTGDFSQLPPVVKDEDRAIYMAAWGRDIGDGYAFNSPYWQSLGIETILLKDIVRQADEVFSGNLSKIRIGDPDGICYFNTHASRGCREGVITLAATNRVVDRINAEHLEALPGELKVQCARMTGEISSGMFPAEETFQYKIGARVMFLINDEENKYRNGTLGTITGMTARGDLLIQIDGCEDDPIRVAPYKWTVNDYSVEKTENGENVLQTHEIGSFTQFPLRLAYAITIHKSQGATFNEMNLMPKCFANGQLYVALSRCRTIEGIHLAYNIHASDLMTSDEVLQFYGIGEDYGDEEYERGEEMER